MARGGLNIRPSTVAQ